MLARAEPILRLLTGLAAALLVVAVVWISRPWERPAAVLRPDTGRSAAALDAAGVQDVLQALLKKVYTAFGQQDEGAIYDGLALAVAPQILTGLYLQRRAAQEAEIEEGGTTEIRAVDLSRVDILERTRDGYRIDAAWKVTGEVGHADHRHERVNAYSAVITLGPAAGAWRLVQFDLNRIEREDVPLFFGDFEISEPEP